MAGKTYMHPQEAHREEVWPPDDTEESVSGTVLHQKTVFNVICGINEAACVGTSPGQPAPWAALRQLLLMGCRRPDGSAYKIRPDVFIYRHPVDNDCDAMDVGVDGPPVLIIEVLSDATVAAELDMDRGKGYSYARAGVREYLALDPTGVLAAGNGRGWRLDGGAYCPWERGADGRWSSEQIDVAIGLEDVWATVYTRDGRRMPREGEIHAELAAALARKDAAVTAALARKDAEVTAALARRDEELARKDAALAELRHRLDELRGRQP